MNNLQSSLPTPTILVADDERTLRNLMSRAVERDGYRSISVSDGYECLAYCQRELPDLILLDAIMPKMGGFECCDRLHALYGKDCPPILIITALQDTPSIERAFEVGAEDYITKPIHWEVLRQRIRRLIRAYQAMRELQRSLQREHDLSSRLSLQVLEERRLARQLELTNQKLELANVRLQELANLDGLTQIANRRAFDRWLNDQWARLSQERESLSLLLFDIDCFKLFNDTYGHQAGDDCLRRVAQVLEETICRPQDFVARYGGEELAAILPHTTLEGAQAVAKRTLEAVRALNIPHQNSLCSDRITLSIGVASVVPALEHPAQPLVRCADLALYRAKSDGRNCLRVASADCFLSHIESAEDSIPASGRL